MLKNLASTAAVLVVTLLLALDPSSVNALGAGDFVINEFLADPAPDLAGDANRDGVRDAYDDEFIEIVNVSGTTMDISGWIIRVSDNVKHTFPADTVLPSGCGIVVFGGGNPGGNFGDSLVQVASSGSLGLTNSNATISLEDGGIVDAYEYIGADQDQSLTRDPDLAGIFTLHSQAAGSNGAIFSPGTKVNGSLFTSGCPGHQFIVYLPVVSR